MYARVFIFLSLAAVLTTATINHLILRDGRISHKIDSPFVLREPGNLVAFLDQIRLYDYVEETFLKLLRRREQIVDHLRFSVKFGEDLVQQAKCAMDYYLMERRMSHLKLTPAYLKRLDFSARIDKSAGNSIIAGEPHCKQATELGDGPCCFDHLESFQPDLMRAARVEREEEVNIGELGSAVEMVRRLAVEGLRQKPDSWSAHTVSSYYWRMRGQAPQALECARLGVKLAPRAFVDIPLLSLGTVLFRAGRLADADVILTAAVEHAPDVPENHMALASTLAMKHDFNRSIFHFDEAERLDASLLPRTQPVRKFISCLDNLAKKTTKMYSYVEYMKNEVKEFKNLKYLISQHHEKLIQQQVPLGARNLDAKTRNEDLLKRGQYCSTRTLSTAEEPVLFCDFYSDFQMRLESKDVDIESLEMDLKLTSEAVIRQVSIEMRKQFNFEQLKASNAQIPDTLKGTGGAAAIDFGAASNDGAKGKAT